MPATIQLGERAIFARLRNLTQEQLKVIAGANEGLENRLIQKLKTATSFEDLLSSVKCKRYTRSRISRLIFNAFLDIKQVTYNGFRISEEKWGAKEIFSTNDKSSSAILVKM